MPASLARMCWWVIHLADSTFDFTLASIPDQVVGMVLIDASYEEEYLRFAALKSPEEREGYLRHESGDNCEEQIYLTVDDLCTERNHSCRSRGGSNG